MEEKRTRHGIKRKAGQVGWPGSINLPMPATSCPAQVRTTGFRCLGNAVHASSRSADGDSCRDPALPEDGAVPNLSDTLGMLLC